MFLSLLLQKLFKERMMILILFAMLPEINAGEVDVVEAVHLGVKVSDKLRPLKVQFRNLSHRRLILIKAKKLHDSVSALMKNVYINPDLSVKERQVQRNLRKKLMRRKQNGEFNLKIHRGKIVKQVIVSACRAPKSSRC